ncbi:hypothetical protein D3C81_1909820 [compost metagenome]
MFFKLLNNGIDFTNIAYTIVRVGGRASRVEFNGIYKLRVFNFLDFFRRSCVSKIQYHAWVEGIAFWYMRHDAFTVRIRFLNRFNRRYCIWHTNSA